MNQLRNRHLLDKNKYAADIRDPVLFNLCDSLWSFFPSGINLESMSDEML